MQKIFKDSIAQAKKYYLNYDDPAHDLSHTWHVVANAIAIAKTAGYQNSELIETAVWWHDVARTVGLEPHEEPSGRMAEKDLISRGVEPKTAALAYEAIRLHKLNDRSSSVEGQIIRDAR